MDNDNLFKKMKKIVLLIIFITLYSCSSDNNTPKNTSEIDKLPPATQTGANTFGCLLDGKAFLPGNGSNPLDCVYQLVGGEYYFELQANKRDEFNNIVLIALGTNKLQIEQGLVYNLLGGSNGNAYGVYSFATNKTYTDNINYGELTITKLTETTVSGTFWYNIIDYQGNLHTIREGRFDMQYSN